MKISQLVSYGLSFIHMTFLKLFHPRMFNSPLVQDISCSTRVAPEGRIKLGERVHTKKNVVIESMKEASIEIGSDSFFNNNCMVVSKERIKIGNSCSCGPNVLIYDHNHKIDPDIGFIHEEYTSSPIVIGDNVWIGANTVILAGTVLGDRCVVGAGSVLKGKYESGSVIVQKRTEELLNKSTAAV